MDLGLEPEGITGVSSFEFPERNKWLWLAESVAEAAFPLLLHGAYHAERHVFSTELCVALAETLPDLSSPRRPLC